MASSSSSGSRHVQIQFCTKQQRYAVPDTPFSIPANVEAEDLNSLIKRLLQESSNEGVLKLDFDFLIGNELLRQPLAQHLEEKDISTETVVEVEYVEKYPSPSPQDFLLHDDWVSSVHASEKWILTGCYDNSLHVWSTDGEHKLTIPGHMGPIKAVTWLKTNADPVSVFATASHDQTAMIWEWNPNTNSIECVYVCRGHARSVDCIAANQMGTKFVTGSWDKMLKIWSSQDEDSENDENRKRLKTESGKGSKNRTPLMTLSGHNEAVCAVQWSSDSEIYSASWDHTIRLWDVELGGLKTQLGGAKSFTDISYSLLNNLIISGSTDRHVRLWDSRIGDGSMVQSVFTSHNGWITCVHWSPRDEFHFVSGSHDMLLKLWDVRSPKAPLYDMSGHEDKIMCCDWSNPQLILSGGSDHHLKLYQA